MSEWRLSSLGSECSRLRSGSNITAKDIHETGEVPVYGGNGIRGYTAESNFSGECAIIGRQGAYCGNVRYFSGRARMSEHAVVVVADDANDTRFLAYLLSTMNLGRLSGQAAQPGLSVKILAQEPVRMPPLEVQRRVASIVGGVDDLIENNRRRVKVLEEMARTIYREWFVKFRYPGHEDVLLVDSALGPIPDGWTCSPLAELVSTQYGYTESASTEPVGPKYLRGMDINKTSYIDWSSVPYCPIEAVDVPKFAIRIGDVFVIRMADPGKIGICEVEVDAVFASYLVRLRPIRDRISPYFLFFTLSDDRYQAWVTGASTGATRKSVSAKVMTEPMIVLPPTDVQQSFGSMVGALRAEMAALTETTAKLRQLRGQLLPKLVTGQIDVSALDLDALIERRVT